MGATLVNISSGARTRFSGFIEGVLSLVAFLLLGALIAWVPVAALAGILIVIGVRMIDRHSLNFLKSRSTILDFAVIAAVIVTALTVSLIAASGVGIALAVFLFIRENVGGAIVRRKSYGNQTFSKQIRLPPEMEILQERGDRTVIFELQGSLFFGTTDQLYSALEADLKTRADQEHTRRGQGIPDLQPDPAESPQRQGYGAILRRSGLGQSRKSGQSIRRPRRGDGVGGRSHSRGGQP
jgi:SulP family sulfate permease